MANHLFDAILGAVRTPDKTLIETAQGARYSYADVLALSAQLANACTALGLEPGDRLLVQTDKSAEVVALYLAAIRAGLIYLPLNKAYTAAEVDYFIHDAEPALIVASPDKARAIEGLALPDSVKAVLTLDADGAGTLMDKAAGAEPRFANVARGPDDIAAILYTSGTTGRSKGAMLSHDNLASNAITLLKAWRFSKDDVLLHALPIFHTHGLFVALNVILLAGASMVFLKSFDADDILRLLPRATTMMGVPTFYVRLLKADGLTREATRHMRLFISGSAPLLAETHREWTERTGHSILERYGMTETNMNTSNPYDGERIAGTVGPPLPGVSIRITDPDSGSVLAPGEIGMIEILGQNVFKGYWRNPEKTRAEFRDDGYFISGDLGFIDERGYVTIVGRGKDLIISGGYNVYPKEVESEIDALDGIIESAVVGVPHPDFGEAVVAFVVRAGGADISAQSIKATLKTRLAAYKCPKHLVFIDELPRNTMGKVTKASLRQTCATLFA